MKGSPDRITSCTTTQFDGVISVIDPDNSWVARWQRTGLFDFSFLFFYILTAHVQFQRNMFVGCMLFALPDAYQKMLSSNSNEEISNIVLGIKLTRIKERRSGNTPKLDTIISIEPLHILRNLCIMNVVLKMM